MVGFDKCVMLCSHHYGIIQNSFTGLKVPFVPPVHPPFPRPEALATANHFTVTVPSPGCPIVGNIQRAAFSDWILSDTPLSFLHVFLCLVLFLLLNTIPLRGCTTVCSFTYWRTSWGLPILGTRKKLKFTFSEWLDFTCESCCTQSTIRCSPWPEAQMAWAPSPSPPGLASSPACVPSLLSAAAPAFFQFFHMPCWIPPQHLPAYSPLCAESSCPKFLHCLGPSSNDTSSEKPSLTERNPYFPVTLLHKLLFWFPLVHFSLPETVLAVCLFVTCLPTDRGRDHIWLIPGCIPQP